MFTDTDRLVRLRIDEAHRQAALERTLHMARAEAAALAAADRTMADERRPADAALMAAGERSDALLRTVSCVDAGGRVVRCVETADRAA